MPQANRKLRSRCTLEALHRKEAGCFLPFLLSTLQYDLHWGVLEGGMSCIDSGGVVCPFEMGRAE